MTPTELFASAGSTEPTPGGGSVTALCGYLGVTLILKAIRISLKRTPSEGDLTAADTRLSSLAPKLLELADADIAAFSGFAQALQLPHNNPSEQQKRQDALDTDAAGVSSKSASTEAIDWLFDPRNRAEAVRIYRTHLPNVSENTAQLHVNALLGEREGFTRGGALDSSGMMTVLRIRSELGVPKKRLTDPGRYVDEGYYRATAVR